MANTFLQGFHFLDPKGTDRRAVAAVELIDDITARVALAVCHPTDTYIKKRGRIIAVGRLEHEDFPIHPYCFNLIRNQDGTRAMRQSGQAEITLGEGLKLAEAIRMAANLCALKAYRPEVEIS